MTGICKTTVIAGLAFTGSALVPHHATAPAQPVSGLAFHAAETMACCAGEDTTEARDSASPPSQPRARHTQADDPTALPKGVAVEGTLQVKGRWDLHKPDLTRAVVHLASHPALDAVPSGIDFATVAQKNKSFIPNFTVVPQGTTIEFPNWDDFDHNVFSRSAAAPAFDLDRYPKGHSKSRIFEKVGVVQIFCNIHPQMRAVIVVTSNRYFAQCDDQGRFTIPNVPPGTYEIVAWQERCGEQRQTIEVGADDPVTVSFTLDESRASIIANDPPNREKDYGVERGLGVKRAKLDLPVVKDSHPARSEPPQ